MQTVAFLMAPSITKVVTLVVVGTDGATGVTGVTGVEGVAGVTAVLSALATGSLPPPQPVIEIKDALTSANHSRLN